ncbi:MAG: aminotransferase class V-fold PLP-dependent enzyme [Calditrichaeota bacterium]|nr:MAG: aminotransferase class V-fold PLP-dependent enzyme [Calditrichota bacterium]MBL1204780.1 aminotransferase class V-fold PLP-dependent enzyme [Calditrichota bacterium]NOG44609.1 aminotransferase class V-fold PLP-dependent enzyme [Calditrichota bacterium]
MLEKYFKKYRDNVIGVDQDFETPFGKQKILYADWTASGRLYKPIEEKLMNNIAPFVGNTHTETSVTGSTMTRAYHEALHIIKKHVGAGPEDIIISSNSGMTGVVNKFQRILGLKIHEKHRDCIKLIEEEKPIVFITHMEHHSNQTSWLETLVDVEIIPHNDLGLVDLEGFSELLKKYETRKNKIAAVTSCSNVTGIITPYLEISEIIHAAGGLCFVDFACSAPYIPINMHPENNAQKLDAIFFSPHKFLGGPGTTGILVFCSSLYDNKIPDNPGGGTVDWTNPWGGHKYVDDIEAREDGGTPAFLQTIKVGLCVKLKEEITSEKMLQREEEMLKIIWDGFDKLENLHVLAGHIRERLGVISFYVDDLHFNLAVRLLNDRFGIQVRGGCSCAGTYGHFLLHVDKHRSKSITDKINDGDLSEKPGWVRLSINPVMSDEEVHFIVQAITDLCNNHKAWAKDYTYDVHSNEFYHKNSVDLEEVLVSNWFK